MKSHIINRLIMANSRGGVLVLVALSLFLFIAIAAVAIDIGYLSTTKNELQDVADAAALAGAGYLGSVYATLPPIQHAGKTFDPAEVLAEINSFQNKAAKSDIEIFLADIKVGKWDPDPNVLDIYDENQPGPDAVSVIARRDTGSNSKISTFFAGIFGAGSEKLAVSAKAIAALSGPSVVGDGELVMPIGLSEKSFPNSCKDLIYFSPTPYSCAGWTTLDDEGISSSSLSDRIFDVIVSDQCDFCGPSTDTGLTQDGNTWLHDNFTPKNLIENNLDSDVSVPTTVAGEEFSFIGGATSQFNGEYLLDYDGNTGTPYGASGELTVETANAPSPMFSMFDYFRYRDGDEDYTVEEDIYDLDGTTLLYPAGHVFPKNSIWSSTVPVYDDDENVNCNGTGTNPNTELPIVGFAKVMVIQPNPPPDNNLNVMIDCKFSVIEGRGGGGVYGNIKGTIPNLVK